MHQSYAAPRRWRGGCQRNRREFREATNDFVLWVGQRTGRQLRGPLTGVPRRMKHHVTRLKHDPLKSWAVFLRLAYPVNQTVSDTIQNDGKQLDVNIALRGILFPEWSENLAKLLAGFFARRIAPFGVVPAVNRLGSEMVAVWVE